MKRQAHPKEAPVFARQRQLRSRAEAELRDLRANRLRRPMMHQLYRDEQAQHKKRRKAAPLRSGTSPDVETPQRLLHELQVHQLELELQNAELQGARNRMEILLEKYTDLYDFAPVGYLTLTHDGTIEMINLTGSQLLGLDRSKLVGRPFGELLAADRRPEFHLFLQQALALPDKHSMDVELRRLGKSTRIVRIEAQHLPNRAACRAVLIDSTSRRQAENQVRVSEIRYRRLFEAAHDGVLLLDPSTRRITDANPFMTKLLGYSHEQLVGKELFEIGLFKDKAASRAMFLKLKLTHEVRYEDLPLKTRRGRTQEVEVVANLYQENGHPVIQCNVRDITERKQAEEAKRRFEGVSASNRRLAQEIVHRRTIEAALRKSESQARGLLAQSRLMQNELRNLSRQILSAQEDERKRISRELHDVIAQTLTGINVRLTALLKEAPSDARNLERSIARTQKLVEHSVSVVHQFARELRPTVLDDLGLIPALHTFMKNLRQETGLRVSFSAYAGVEKVSTEKRVVLFRVAQEALNNVARHAHASRVDVMLQKHDEAVCMKIVDDGRGLPARRNLRTQKEKRLGLLGMHERLEMVGGSVTVTSTPGHGTAVIARIPIA